MLGELFAVLAPVLVCAGIGYGWARFRQPYDVDLVTALVFFVGTPCLVFSTLLRFEMNPAMLGEIALLAALAVAAFLAIGALTLRLAGLPHSVFLPAMSFPNTGNMGLPICLFAFGESGLALGIAFFAVTSTSMFTIGLWVSSGTMSPRNLVRTPLLYALALAVGFVLTESRPPAWIIRTTDLIGAMTIPLMLITLGVSLSRLRVTSLGRSLGLAALRLGMGLAVGLGLAELFVLEGVTRGVFVIQCTMPVAVFTYLFAQRFQREPAEVASVVVMSTTLSFATLPLLLFLAR